MLDNIVDNIRKERAEFAREVEYIKETAYDDDIDDRLEVAESLYVGETVSELEEAARMVDQLPSIEEEYVKEAEINRILKADSDISFDEMCYINEAAMGNKELIKFTSNTLSNINYVVDINKTIIAELNTISKQVDPKSKNALDPSEIKKLNKIRSNMNKITKRLDFNRDKVAEIEEDLRRIEDELTNDNIDPSTRKVVEDLVGNIKSKLKEANNQLASK